MAPASCRSMNTSSTERRFMARLATDEPEILESLQLRYRIFAGELGAQLESACDGIDKDQYDPHCRHLIVRDTLTGKMVASTRLLDEHGAAAAGGFYSENEFDLGFLHALPGSKMEVGRTCVDPEFRNGAVIATLWSQLAQCVRDERVDYLFGCASIGLADGHPQARAVMSYLTGNYLSPPVQRAHPYQTLPPQLASAPATTPRLPPLVKAYVSLGAVACGEAYWDRDFDCLDVFMLLDLARLEPRYRRRFMRPQQEDVVARAA
jgi:putative hemolysin